jgi:Rrf2 family protein
VATNLQFSIAVHFLAGLGFQCGREMTSAAVARSVNTSPSFVRRVLSKLSKAGLVTTVTGQGGSCRLARDAEQISLLDVYQAVQAPKAFAIHTYRELKPCPVSCHIKTALEKSLGQAQHSLEAALAKITLADIIADIRQQ